MQLTANTNLSSRRPSSPFSCLLAFHSSSLPSAPSSRRPSFAVGRPLPPASSCRHHPKQTAPSFSTLLLLLLIILSPANPDTNPNLNPNFSSNPNPNPNPNPSPSRRLHSWLRALRNVPSRGCFAFAQQPGPLEGQGVNPRAAGLSNDPVPVFLSVDLLKLAKVDQKEYSFNAVFSVVQAWQDERAVKLSQAIATTAADARAFAEQQLLKCLNSSNGNGSTPGGGGSSSSSGGGSSSCADATAGVGASSKCRRLCVPTDHYLCCDAVWLPSFSLTNLLELPQDRFIADGVYFLRSFNPSLVVRTTRIEGTFSSVFNFASFPFDRQVLSVRIDSGSSDYIITPSLVSRGFMSPSVSYWNVSRFSNSSLPFANLTPPYIDGVLPVPLPQVYQQQFPSDEVAEWCITGLELVCPPVTTRLTLADSYVEGLNLADPTLEPYRIALNSTEMYTNISCTFNIHVSRLSTNYVLVVIIPTMLTVMLSLAAFFARPADLDVRITTAVTLFLTLVAVQFVIDDQLPKAQYLTSFGLLVIISYFVIFAVVLESIFVFHLHCYEESFLRRRRVMREEEERRRRRKKAAALASGRSGSWSGKSLLSGKSFLRSLTKHVSPSLRHEESIHGDEGVKRDAADSYRTDVRRAETELTANKNTGASVRWEASGKDEDVAPNNTERAGETLSGRADSIRGGEDPLDYEGREAARRDANAGGRGNAGHGSAGGLESIHEGVGRPVESSDGRQRVQDSHDSETINRSTERHVEDLGRDGGADENGGEAEALLEPDGAVPLIADRIFCRLVNSRDEAVWLAERLDLVSFCLLFVGYFVAAIIIFAVN